MDSNNTTVYHVNDYILHGGSGVCKIQDICIPNTNRIDSSRTYYQLQPLYEKGSVIYTPTDNTASILRKILTREEAMGLIRQIPYLESLWIDNEKSREEAYRAALRTNDCREWVRVLKTLYLRGKARVQEGKKISQTDEKYARIAEDLLYGELSISMGIPKDQVEKFITDQIHSQGQEELCS